MMEVMKKVNKIKNRIKELYLNREEIFVIGFSGGKDSTLVLTLFLEVLMELKEEGFVLKKSYVISSDTLIENPIVTTMINRAKEGLAQYKESLNIEFHHVLPRTDETFWSVVLGNGYPLPLNKFRWCTRNLKIRPINIKNGEIALHEKNNIISVMGLRKKESASRKAKMEENATDEKDLMINKEAEYSTVFAPISDLSIEELWRYLLYKQKSEWNLDFRELYEAYFDSSNECPMALEIAQKEEMIEKCGNSRWGCWMCPLANTLWIDNMVDNGYTDFKPLADLRKKMISERDNRENRYLGSHRILKNGTITLYPRGLVKLKKKEGSIIIQKKGNRDERIFTIHEGYLVESNGRKYPVYDKEYYYNEFKEHPERFYDDEVGGLISYFVLDGNDYFAPSTGPYTIQYRKMLLRILIDLKKQYNDVNLEVFGVKYIDIISEEEINHIERLQDQIQQEISRFINRAKK